MRTASKGDRAKPAGRTTPVATKTTTSSGPATSGDDATPSAEPTGPTKQMSAKKWGKEVMALGYQIVPSLLLKAQRRLNITPTQLAVLIHIMDHWWFAESMPWPSKKTLAERVNLSARQVQRCIADLQKAGLLERVPRSEAGKGIVSNQYNLGGLVARLQEIEPEFTDAERAAKEIRSRVRRRGFRPTAKQILAA